MREVVFEVLTDTSMFNPVQLQPRFMMSIAFNGWSRWIRQYLVPFPVLVREHRFGVVVVGVHLEYPEPLGFLETDSGEVRVRMRARLGGALLETEFSAMAAGKQVVRGVAVLLPVKIDDIQSLSASPARLSDDLLARLQGDEVDKSAPRRPVRRLLREIEGGGRSLAEGTYPFTVYRHACEVADQWCVAEIPCYASEAREALSLARGDEVPELRKGLGQPLRNLDLDLARPMYVFDQGAIATTAYEVDGRIAFVHRIRSSHETHGVVIERF
jgi:hypothetical protein